MNNTYSLIINFLDQNNQIDYQKIKMLLANNLEHGQNNFYISTRNSDYSSLSCQDKKSYYHNMVKLMPAESEFKIELNFDSLSDTQAAIKDLSRSKRVFDLVIKIPSITGETMDSYFKDYITYLNLISKNTSRDLYISSNSRLLSLIDSEILIEKTKNNKSIKGFVSYPAYPYDLDFKEFSNLKKKYSQRFEFLAAADDFYYINLKNGVDTISKYFSLLSEFFQNIQSEFEKNNLERAKDYQLILNDFINTVNNFGGEIGLKYLLSKKLNFDLDSKESLTEGEKLILESKSKNVGNYFE